MTDERESGTQFLPKFDDKGLLTAVVSDAQSGELLMVAFMNNEAVNLTCSTGIAHFWSRSRQSLWKKGETSGNFLRVKEIRVDCDQDCLWIIAVPDGPACHTGEKSCFYRRLSDDYLVRL